MKKVIACGIFRPYIEHLNIDKSQYTFKYLDIHQHDQPQKLAKQIQKEINNARNFDSIIILYGLCGGTLLSLQAVDIPIVLVRVHDCMSILLGSKIRYEQLTKDTKSLSWSCYSLKEENDFNNEMITRWELLYDEETVEYLKSMLISEKSLYISFSLPQEKKYLDNQEQVIEGDLQFLKQILLLESQELLYVYPHQTIKQTLDYKIFEIKEEN